MSVDAVTLFLALLTVAAQLAVVGLGVIAVAAIGSHGAREYLGSVRASLGSQTIPLALLVAITAMAGSLWFSEGAHFIPCKLCWYQRIAMYPLVPLLAVATLRRDLSVRPYALALVVIGLPISTYHYLLERFPSLETGACDVANPCSIVWVWRFHYISIPLMAGTGFALIGALLLLAPNPKGP